VLARIFCLYLQFSARSPIRKHVIVRVVLLGSFPLENVKPSDGPDSLVSLIQQSAFLLGRNLVLQAAPARTGQTQWPVVWAVKFSFAQHYHG
jgi:hypothetical protein